MVKKGLAMLLSLAMFMSSTTGVMAAEAVDAATEELGKEITTVAEQPEEELTETTLVGCEAEEESSEEATPEATESTEESSSEDASAGEASEEASEEVTDVATEEDSEEIVVEEVEEQELVGAPAHVHCICGSDSSETPCDGKHSTGQKWKEFSSENSLPTEEAGYYYLTSDVTLDQDYTTDKDISICLNGHKVYTKGHSYQCTGSLVITDCGEGGAIIEDSETIASDHSYIINAKNLTMYNTSISASNVSCAASGFALVGYANISSVSSIGFGSDSNLRSTYKITNCKLTMDNVTVASSGSESSSTTSAVSVANTDACDIFASNCDLTVKGCTVSSNTGVGIHVINMSTKLKIGSIGRGEYYTYTVRVHDSNVSADKCSLKVAAVKGPTDLDILDSTITAVEKGEAATILSDEGYAVFPISYDEEATLSVYLGGHDKISGPRGINSDSISAKGKEKPQFYAYSMNKTALEIPNGQRIGLWEDDDEDKVEGQQIIQGGMNEDLVDKLTLINPPHYRIDADGKAVAVQPHTVSFENTELGAAASYDEDSKELDEFYPGEIVYIKAEPGKHAAFQSWSTTSPTVVFEDDYAIETTFIMPDDDVIITPIFDEAPYLTVTYRGGAESDGTVQEFTDKKYYGEDIYLSTKVFKNTNVTLSQIGWTTLNGETTYELGGEYTLDEAVVLYPVWTTNYAVTLKYGAHPAGTHASEDVAIEVRKTPGIDYKFDTSMVQNIGYLKGSTDAGDYYYRQEADGTLYKLAGFSLTADGAKCDYKIDGVYTTDADLVIYPYWERIYRINFKSGAGAWGRDGNDDYTLRKFIGEDATLLDSMFLKDGYVQTGWNTKENGSGTAYAFGATYSEDKDLTLFPVWKKGQTEDAYCVKMDNARRIYVANTDKVVYIMDYTGAAIKPTLRIYDGDVLLKEKTDYTLSYKNNTNVNIKVVELAKEGKSASDIGALSPADLKKLPSITINGKGNYAQKQVIYFAIASRNIGDGSFAATDDYVFEYKEKKGAAVINKPVPAVTGTINGKTKKLAANKEFTVRYYKAALDAKGNYQTDEDGFYLTDGEALPGIAAVGYYVVKLDGTGNFKGSISVRAQVTDSKTPISKAKVKYSKSLPYDGGKAVTQPALSVTLGKELLTEADYEVRYENNTEIGTAKMLIMGKGRFAGSIPLTFSIVGTPLSKVKQESKKFQASFEYDGAAHQPDTTNYFYVLNAEKQPVYLLQGRDYTVSTNASGVEVGTYTVTYTGKGAYSGTVKKQFKITPYDMAKNSGDRIVIPETAGKVAYSKGGAVPAFDVQFKKADGTTRTLVKGTDYVLVLKNNTTVNDGSNPDKWPTAIVQGKGAFKNKLNKAYYFTITAKDLSLVSFNNADKVYVEKADNYVNTFAAVDDTGKALKAGADFDSSNIKYYYVEAISRSGDNCVKNAGLRVPREAGEEVYPGDVVPIGAHIEARINGKGFYRGTASVKYHIRQYDLTKSTVSFNTEFYYNRGKEIQPSASDITLTYKADRNVTLEYEIVPGSYKNNTKVGLGSFQIRGKGNSAGTMTVKFKILPKWMSKLFG